MSLRVYVATAFTNVVEARYWIARLKEIGVIITHDWTSDEMPVGQSELTRSLKAQEELALADIRGVLTADVLWLLSPPTGGTGCWFELGLAYGRLGREFTAGVIAYYPGNIRIISSGPRRTIFQAAIKHVDTHARAFKTIEAIARCHEDGGKA